MIKKVRLLLVVSSVFLVSACTPLGEAIEDVIESESVETIVKTESEELSSQELEERDSKESRTTEEES